MWNRLPGHVVDPESLEVFKSCLTNLISIKVGTLPKNAIKTKICNLLIHFNLYLTDKMTKKRVSVFSLMNLLNIDKFTT